MRVLVGGTFDDLHEGHRSLLRLAVSTGTSDLLRSPALNANGEDNVLVYVGLTVGDLAARPERHVRAWSARAAAIHWFIRNELGYGGPLAIRPLEDRAGPALDNGTHFDALVVSDETKSAAAALNDRRRSLGMRPLELIICTIELDSQNLPISSTKSPHAARRKLRSAL